jgi:phosphoglycerate dehydrogenase-like enzyme
MHPALLLTQRSERHQQRARQHAPPELQLTICRNASRAEILRLLPEMEFLISERAGRVDAEMIAVGKRLRLIQRWGRQTWDIDVEAARQAGVPVCYWPIASCGRVAEHLVLQILTLLRRLNEQKHTLLQNADWGSPRRAAENTFAYNWTRRENIGGLAAKTVGIWGFGEIGRELAERLRGFDCAMLYHKRQRLPAHVSAQLGVAYASPAELAAQSDVLCCLLPFSAETEQSLNANFFSRMKRGALLAHCGASGVVDEAALLEALRAGQLGGAALDTFTWEPLPANSPLLSALRDPALNLLLTPHTAAGTAAERADDFANLRAILCDEALRYRLA